MSAKEQLHYHCLIDLSDQSIISQGMTELKDCSPYEFGSRLIERWGKDHLSSMEDEETRTLDYYYATNLIRPHRSVGTFTKGPILTIRSVMGSPHPGYEEHLPYQYGYDERRPARYDEFPFPEDVPDFLSKENFYDEEAILSARTECVEEMKSAVRADFSPEAIESLIRKAEILVASMGGRGLHPHPVPFCEDSEEHGGILILDFVFYAILKTSPDALSSDVILAHQERRKHSDISDYDLRETLASMK